jgi:NAD dependent epimerase/dehydratase family enzyme
VVVVSRGGARDVSWDGRTLGAWSSEIDGADVVLNLAGRSVNCRYTEKNLAEMMS